ncbi:MAG TPA: hypothetical protein VF988_05745, partial [Verrucomicrobiae bacterium]
LPVSISTPTSVFGFNVHGTLVAEPAEAGTPYGPATANRRMLLYHDGAHGVTRPTTVGSP